VCPVDGPGAFDQEYVCAAASHWRAMVIFERLLHMAHEERPDSVTCVFGHCDLRVLSVRKVPSEGVMAILALRAIKGVCGQPWHMLRTLGT
jgi:hypothetical protein